MKNFETSYFKLVNKVLNEGYLTSNRNGFTASLIGETLRFSLYENEFPLLTSRKYNYAGVFGEFAALVRGPKKLSDFVEQGCPYWVKWAEDDLSLNLDYGNAWLDFNGVNQLEWLVNEIKANPTSRRLIVSGWRPDHVINNKLSLPCCHYSYQFIVRDDTLNMIWIQRSADLMVGVPADAILASLWVIMLANEVGLEPGEVVMQFGDTHIYEEHTAQAEELYRTWRKHNYNPIKRPKFKLWADPCKPFVKFVKSDLEVVDYEPLNNVVNFLLKE